MAGAHRNPWDQRWSHQLRIISPARRFVKGGMTLNKEHWASRRQLVCGLSLSTLTDPGRRAAPYSPGSCLLATVWSPPMLRFTGVQTVIGRTRFLQSALQPPTLKGTDRLPHLSFIHRVTGSALKNPLVVTRIAPLYIRLWQPHGRRQRHRMRLVAVAALWDVLRVMGHIAVRTLLWAVGRGIVSSCRNELIEWSVTRQASVFWTAGRLCRNNRSRGGGHGWRGSGQAGGCCRLGNGCRGRQGGCGCRYGGRRRRLGNGRRGR
jgi:hypothetical protein